MSDKDKRNPDDYYTCQKAKRPVPKDNPVCLSPKNYCQHRHMCMIYELYKKSLKKKTKETKETQN